MTFDDIIAPIGRDAFFTSYWERAPLIVRRNAPDYFQRLLSAEDIDAILTSTDLRYPAMRLVKDGKQLPLNSYTDSFPYAQSAFRNVPDVDRALDEYSNGATMVFQALHKYWRPLSRLCRSIESAFHHGTQTNVYLTPSGSQGFAPHFDTHDVFVLQVHGAKRWRIYDSAMELPLQNQKFNRDRDPLPPLLHDLDIRAGDMVYLPRGFVHEALTSDVESLHITLGLTTHTWLSVFKEILKLCEKDARFRRSLPMSYASDGAVPSTAEYHASLLQAFSKPEYLEAALNGIAEQFVQTRIPMLDGRLNEIHSHRRISADTPLRWRPSAMHRLRKREGRALLFSPGKRMSFPAHVEPALSRIVEGYPFTPEDLTPTLDLDGRLTLCRRLMKEGLLEYAG